MKNKIEDHVIKCLSIEHGAEIIQYFKDLGVDTNLFDGSIVNLYYGIHRGLFNCFALSHAMKAIELPKKMYSVQEIKSNPKIVIQVDSQEDVDKLISIDCVGYKNSYYPYYTIPCGKQWSMCKDFLESDDYTIITVNQIKELNMEKEQKILGYKLIKPEYLEACYEIAKLTTKTENNLKKLMSDSLNVFTINCFKKAGVLDLWFEPVFKETYKVGDWVYIKETKPGAFWANNKVGEITIEKNNYGLNCNEYGINVKIGSEICKIGTESEVKIRLATKEEIEKAQEKVYTLGIDEKFEIVVKDKKAYYTNTSGSEEDVTETLIAFKEYINCKYVNSYIGKYTWNFGDQIINSVGCIRKSSYVSEWLAIDLN